MIAFRFLIAQLILGLLIAVPPAHAQDNARGTWFDDPGYVIPEGASARDESDLRQSERRRSGAPGSGGYDSPTVLRNDRFDGMNGGQPGQGRRQTPLPYRMQRGALPPPPPSQFQKFVETATGRLLPLFGSRFFRDAPDDYSAVENLPVPGDYVIGPGDELLIRAWGSIDIDYRALVDRNGQVSLPRVGTFSVAGVKAENLQKHLRDQIGRLFTNFSLNVTLGQLRAVKVFVVGPARWPGVYTLSSQSTLLSAVVAAGGPAPHGSMRTITLKRDDRVISELDVYDFLVQGDKSKDVPLAPGDVIVFHAAGPHVALNGALDTPAVYELKSPQEPLRGVLRYAGGAPLLANPHRVQLERIDTSRPGAARFVEEFALDGQGLEKPLRDGDVLTLLDISPRFANAVTLRGQVAQPLRYPFTPGMRIRDLIPDKDALISPDFYRRKNLLVQVIEDDRTTREERGPGARRPSGSDTRGTDTRGMDSRMIGRGDVLAGDRAAQRGAAAWTASPDTRKAPGDSQAPDERAAPQRGEPESSALAGPRTRKPPSTLFDELNWDYAVIERLNRQDLSTQIIPFNLGRAVLQNDPSQNLELQPGDVVTIYSQKDLRVPVARQTRLVWVEGEVGSPGVYQLLPGETLPQLIARAGGFTPHAYVYGLEFSREETRQRQRENLQQAIARLEALSATQTAREAANRGAEVPAERAIAVANAATEAQLARLRNLEPNGRIALELSIDDASLDRLPPVPLEHADRILVPARPGFVTVAGAVVNSNAFLWRPDRSANDYLKLAGLDEAADKSNMFILRADGTVAHSNERRGFFGYGGGIGSLEMHPGDALIVPNQLDFETWGRALVRNLKDWSQIFAQFGLGAAAIQTLRSN